MAGAESLDAMNRIEEEAAGWVARRADGPLDTHSQHAFERWLAESPAHQAAIDEFGSIWGGLGMIAREIGPVVAPVPANDRGWLRRHAAAAAVAVMLTGSAIFAGYRIMAPPAYETEIGGRKMVALSDGSQITLNTGTRLKADLSDDRRVIRLEQGEALFEVAHDTARPFIVETPFGSVRAVGTKFVVRLDDAKKLAVVVTQGRVVVAARDKAESLASRSPVGVPLSAGEELTSAGPKFAVAPISPESINRTLAWRRGEIYFEGQSLGEAVAQMQRYSDQAIIVDPAIADYHVGGSFRTSDLDAFLGVLQQAFPLKILRNGDEIHIVPADA